VGQGAVDVLAVETLVDTYLSVRVGDERFLDTFRRVGVAPFKEAVYGSSDRSQRAAA
jgi:sulfite reductase (NADPH) hemoprotein beta-component